MNIENVPVELGVREVIAEHTSRWIPPLGHIDRSMASVVETKFNSPDA